MTYITYSAYPPGCSGPPEDDPRWDCPDCDEEFEAPSWSGRCPSCGWDGRREADAAAVDAAADRMEDTP